MVSSKNNDVCLVNVLWNDYLYFSEPHYTPNNNPCPCGFVPHNSNTHNLEGSWAFLSYTMTKTGQSIVGNLVSIEAYFQDTKPKETVIDAIQNRVQLYLEETN